MAQIVFITKLAALAEAVAELRDAQQHAAQAAAARAAAERLYAAARPTLASPVPRLAQRTSTAAQLAALFFPHLRLVTSHPHSDRPTPIRSVRGQHAGHHHHGHPDLPDDSSRRPDTYRAKALPPIGVVVTSMRTLSTGECIVADRVIGHWHKTMKSLNQAGSSGGRGNEGGSLHRSGVAAYLAAHGLVGRGLEAAGNSEDGPPPTAISFETGEAVDDLRCELRDGTALLLQAKRTCGANRFLTGRTYPSGSAKLQISFHANGWAL